MTKLMKMNNDCWMNNVKQRLLKMKSVKGVRMDNAEGPDNIIPRSLKTFRFNKILAMIFTFHSSTSFRKARKILIDKGGDVFSPNNWRPISICSLIRRVFEGILDRLRKYITANDHQRGFTSISMYRC